MIWKPHFDSAQGVLPAPGDNDLPLVGESDLLGAQLGIGALYLHAEPQRLTTDADKEVRDALSRSVTGILAPDLGRPENIPALRALRFELSVRRNQDRKLKCFKPFFDDPLDVGLR